jgi:hypothetical protein
MLGWRLEEAVALSFSKDPEVVHEASLRTYKEVSYFAKQYMGVRDFALRAKESGQLTDPVLPKDFLEWAIRYEINVPAQLGEKVEAHGGSIDDWKARFETLRAQCDEKLKAKDQQIDELIQELKALREQNEKLESRLASDPPLREKERNSLLRMVLGMAVDKYGYIPGADKNRATGSNAGSIPAALDDLELSVDSDTVRKYLHEAEARFSVKHPKSVKP